MRQAILTKYISPTNHRRARIKARCAAGSVMYNWNHDLDAEENHRAAAMALINELGWTSRTPWIGGSVHNGDYVFVNEAAK